MFNCHPIAPGARGLLVSPFGMLIHLDPAIQSKVKLYSGLGIFFTVLQLRDVSYIWCPLSKLSLFFLNYQLLLLVCIYYYVFYPL